MIFMDMDELAGKDPYEISDIAALKCLAYNIEPKISIGFDKEMLKYIYEISYIHPYDLKKYSFNGDTFSECAVKLAKNYIKRIEEILLENESRENEHILFGL